MKKYTYVNQWIPQPAAENVIKELLKSALYSNPLANQYTTALLGHCGIRMRDILDHIVVSKDQLDCEALSKYGWLKISENENIYRNSLGFFPTILIGHKFAIAFKVDDIELFKRLICPDLKIHGKKDGIFRFATAWSTDIVDFVVVERNGYIGFELQEQPDHILQLAVKWQEKFLIRDRNFRNVKNGLVHTLDLAVNCSNELGSDWACSLFLKSERSYWQKRNSAGRIQKKRQDEMGLGWANQDHHTYDNSRKHFSDVISILETFGFICRERFYAGADAGWGSQILEQPVVGSIVFADIDLAPEELDFDFAHTPLKPLDSLKRAGLWTALHGESMLQSGLNHLECMFDSKILHQQFVELGISLMKPFSDFPHLYQELTIGEWWPVKADRISKLFADGFISKEQADNFREYGAIGSHFENLERNDGYKGFNQPGIDGVLRIIDPRKNLVNVSQAE